MPNPSGTHASSSAWVPMRWPMWVKSVRPGLSFRAHSIPSVIGMWSLTVRSRVAAPSIRRSGPFASFEPGGPARSGA